MDPLQQTENIAGQIPQELAIRLAEVADKTNQGENFSREDYLLLWTVGVAAPVVIMLAGWFL
jgi:hypothetical protein